MSFFKKLLFFYIICGHIHTSAAASTASRTSSAALTLTKLAYLTAQDEKNCYNKNCNNNDICKNRHFSCPFYRWLSNLRIILIKLYSSHLLLSSGILFLPLTVLQSAISQQLLFCNAKLKLYKSLIFLTFAPIYTEKLKILRYLVCYTIMYKCINV